MCYFHFFCFSKNKLNSSLYHFRILRIGNANLEYEELSSGLRGTANLEEQAAPSQ